MCRKVSFPNEAAAQASADAAEANGTAGWRPTNVYECRHCGGWHWGHIYHAEKENV